MAKLSDLQGLSLKLVNCTTTGNIFSGGGFTCLLKEVNREYRGTIKKPVYYLASILNGHSEYLSGLFATGDPCTFSADYKDAIGIKKLVKVIFADSGETMTIEAS
jgi:hypothetical protein